MAKPIRPIRIEGDLAYITLTKGYTAVIDAADVPLVSDGNWTALVVKHTVYARRVLGPTGNQRAYYLHRVIVGSPEGLEIDHWDRNGLNNRRGNLRLATPEENRRNQGLSVKNRSGFKGVGWDKDAGKWRARIMVKSKLIHLGMFDIKEDAAAAYAKASAELHGEFGCIA